MIPARDQTLHAQYRRTLVGPGLNEPEQYPGYTGFVGWQGVCRTGSDALLVTFTSGYWHASPPTPLSGRRLEQLRQYGITPPEEAPRGGRAHFMRSQDGGLTWSSPETLINTSQDDRAPAPALLSDGTILVSFFTGGRVGILRSHDDGKTWDEPPRYLEGPFQRIATNGPPVELDDKSVLVVVYTRRERDETTKLGVFRSADQGETWQHIATLSAPFDLDEPGITQMHDGRLMVVCRREGAVAWSDDKGFTWTEPIALPFKMYDPWLLTLQDGTLMCVHASYAEGKRGVRAILSPDGGETWHAAGPDYGFSIDPSVYGYSRGVQLDDGSIYLVYQNNGGHRVEQIERQKIHAIRFRVLEDCQGIELLPAPGSPADET